MPMIVHKTGAPAAGMTAALLAATCVASGVGAQEAYAGSSSGIAASTTITIAARVLEHTNLNVLYQVRELAVTDADIRRGYVDVPAATRVNVHSNDQRGYLLAFEVTGMRGTDSLFNPVDAWVGAKQVQLSKGGGWILQPYVRGGVTLEVSYRLAVPKDAQPGTYSWPNNLAISALPL